MKKTNCKIVKISTQILTCFILAAIFCVSCIQIYDRCTFHKHVKKVATEYVDSVKKRQLTFHQGSSCNNQDSVIVKPVVVTTNAEERNSLYNNSFNTLTDFEISVPFPKVFDILSESDGILSANGITFLITLIVALLVTLLIYRMEAEYNLSEKIQKEQKKVEKMREKINNELKKVEKQKEEIKLVVIHSGKIDHTLTRFTNIYNLVIILGNVVMSLSKEKSEKENNNISTKAGELCSRLSLTCNEIITCFNDQKQKLDYLTIDEREFLYTYISDALGELERSQDTARSLEITTLCHLIENNIYNIEDIKNKLDCIKLKKDSV